MAASAITAVLIYRKYLWKYFPTPDPDKKLSFKEELGLAKIILKFSIPVAITGLSELAIYDVSTFMIGRYMTEKDAGYYGVADPIARLPLIISLSVAAAILPAASEAASLKDKKLLETYVTQSYRYVILTNSYVLNRATKPMSEVNIMCGCVGISYYLLY